MRKGTKWLVAMAVLTIGLAALPLAAQQSGLVNVDIKNVANNIAQNLSVNVSQIPVTVQAPIDVAAQVCGVDVNVLTQQAAQGNATCTAKQTSSALNTI